MWATVSINPPRNLTHPYLPSIFAIQSHSTFLKEEDYNKSLEKYKETISQHESKIESFYEQMKQLKDAIMERTKEMDGVRIELTETKKKCDEQIENISKEVNIISGRIKILQLTLCILDNFMSSKLFSLEFYTKSHSVLLQKET